MCKSVQFLVAAVCLLGGGCKSGDKNAGSAEQTPGRRGGATNNPAGGERSSVRSVQIVTGRIVAVRENLRFAVIDFGSGKVPRLDQRLWAYRLDQKVAELKVSGPFLGTTVAADVVAGEVREGDLIREQ